MELRDAVAVAEELLAEHGLDGWTVVLDRARTRAGVCREDRRQIGLSAPLTLLHSPAEVRDTVLHEIAHALVGTRHGHDAVWRAAARRIGCSGARTTSAPRPPGRWRGVCPAGHAVTRHRRPARLVACGACARGFSPEHLLTWHLDGREVPVTEMGDRYRADHRALRAGLLGAPGPAGALPAPPLPVGTAVRLLGTGRYAGLSGRVLRRARTRYHVQTAAGVLTAAFTAVEPLA
ncbi:SprT-like domain-containing protein [Kineococcus sp. SYSU DK018]|uniref:SprT-like domain-containing protein n=1 Tax=Kineococcus sp. SYSU DK018 TaxID=3383139 RepID=UPI003D7E6EB2